MCNIYCYCWCFICWCFVTTRGTAHAVPAPEFFVNEIFDKYGNHNVLTYEGFEHLLENLGLARLSFDHSHDLSIHKINGTFKEIHDEYKLHYHSHKEGDASGPARRKRHLSDGHVQDNSTEEVLAKEDHCMSTQEILESYGMEPTHGLVISHAGFFHICPAIVYELDQKHCWGKKILLRNSESKRNRIHVWLEATASIVTMSVAGIMCAAIVPLLSRNKDSQLIQYLMAIAAGTLIGDAFIHLLPQVLQSDEPHDKTSLLRATLILLSMVIMFVVDVGLRAFRQEKEVPVKEEEQHNILEKEHSHQHSHQKQTTLTCAVISGDVLHNMTDGLSIGAAFSSGQGVGLACAIAVFCHELPHELGDYAVLLKEGMGVKKALLFNLFSSLFSFIGMAIGILLGEVLHAAPWINAFTAGSFIYIALVHLVPELKQAKTKEDVLCRTFGLVSGITLMLIIGFYEEAFEKLLTSKS